jgi:hypothetical protein
MSVCVTHLINSAAPAMCHAWAAAQRAATQLLVLFTTVQSGVYLKLGMMCCTGDVFAAKAAAYLDVIDSPGSEPDPTPNAPEPDDLHNPDDR